MGMILSAQKSGPLPRAIRYWLSAEDDILASAIVAGDAAGQSRTVTVAATTPALPGRTLDAVQNRVNRLIACGRIGRVRDGQEAPGRLVTYADVAKR